MTSPPRSSMSSSSAAGHRAVAIDRRPFVREELERPREPGLHEPIARLEKLAARRSRSGALAHRHDRREHREARGVGGRHRDAVAGESERRLDEPRPRQAAVPLPERVEPGGHAGHGARADPDGVVDELGPERHLEPHELGVARLGAEAGNGDEEVEELRATLRPRPTRARGRRPRARS